MIDVERQKDIIVRIRDVFAKHAEQVGFSKDVREQFLFVVSLSNKDYPAFRKQTKANKPPQLWEIVIIDGNQVLITRNKMDKARSKIVVMKLIKEYNI